MTVLTTVLDVVVLAHYYIYIAVTNTTIVIKHLHAVLLKLPVVTTSNLPYTNSFYGIMLDTPVEIVAIIQIVKL